MEIQVSTPISILESQFKLAMEALSCAIFVVDSKGTITFTNSKAQELFGYQSDELKGLSVEALVPHRMAHAHVGHRTEYMHQPVARRLGHGRDLFGRHKDGTDVPVEISLTPIHMNGKAEILVTMIDLTRRKAAERKLIESEKRYRELFENMLDGFAYCKMLFDDRGQPDDFIYLEVNSTFGEITGLKDVINKRVTEVIPNIKVTNPEIFEVYGRVVLTGKSEKYETFIASMQSWFSISAYRPEPRFFIAIFENVTARKLVDLENARLLNEAKKAVQLRDNFLAMASHELRTPLSSISLQLQLISRMSEDGTLSSLSKENASELFEISKRQLARFTVLIGDLLDISQLDTGRLVKHKEDFDLTELLRNILINFKEEILRSGSKIIFDVKSPIIGHWDKSRIEQVIVNLIANALKYGSRKPIEISTQQEGSTAKIEVRDHGIGISIADQAAIFERFGRAESAKSFGGLGLGLFIARKIVEEHQGSIEVKSEIDKGSTFTVKLPLNI